jgi:hypothetical protein
MADIRMTWLRNRDFLTRRIDRCYLIAAGARAAHKRKVHLELARHYRTLLGSISEKAPVERAI